MFDFIWETFFFVNFPTRCQGFPKNWGFFIISEMTANLHSSKGSLTKKKFGSIYFPWLQQEDQPNWR